MVAARWLSKIQVRLKIGRYVDDGTKEIDSAITSACGKAIL
jgi:hypothetical protein